MNSPPTIGPLEAYRHVMMLASRRGESALRLAAHAAVPQVLRPELLHLLKLNFVAEAANDAAVETDVLLASFCEDLGNGYFRFDGNARVRLLEELERIYERDANRARDVGAFLLAYFAGFDGIASLGNDPIHEGYVELERWNALGFYDPDAAAEQLAEAVHAATTPGKVTARIQISGLSSTLATPLVRHQKLLAYAAGLEALQAGDLGSARKLLSSLDHVEFNVGRVVVPSPRTLTDKILVGPEEAEPAVHEIVRRVYLSEALVKESKESIARVRAALAAFGYQVARADRLLSESLDSYATDLSTIQRKIAESELFLTILGKGLGGDSGRRFQQMREFGLAEDAGVPRLIFIRGKADEKFPSKSAGDDGAWARFRREVARKSDFVFFDTALQLERAVRDALQRLQNAAMAPATWDVRHLEYLRRLHPAMGDFLDTVYKTMSVEERQSLPRNIGPYVHALVGYALARLDVLGEPLAAAIARVYDEDPEGTRFIHDPVRSRPASEAALFLDREGQIVSLENPEIVRTETPSGFVITRYESYEVLTGPAAGQKFKWTAGQLGFPTYTPGVVSGKARAAALRKEKGVKRKA